MGPLKGKSTTFVVGNREANAALAKSLISCLAHDSHGCTLFDLDALYSSNADSIFEGLDEGVLRDVDVLMPEPGSDPADDFPDAFGRRPGGLVIVDSMNTLYHLMSLTNRSSRSRKLAFLVAGLSYEARNDQCAVIFTMYRRERLRLAGGNRPISELSDNTVYVEQEGSVLVLSCKRGEAWPGRTFRLPAT